MNETLHLKRTIRLRKIADRYLVVDIGSNQLFAINSFAAYILGMIRDERKIDLNKICNTYNAPKNVIEADVSSFLSFLKASGLLEKGCEDHECTCS